MKRAITGASVGMSQGARLFAAHRSEGFAHPMKRWFSFLAPSTVWIDDVEVWKVK